MSTLSAQRIDPQLEIDLKHMVEMRKPGELPRVFDFSTLNSFQACARKGFHSYIEHLRLNGDSAHPLTFGSAIHMGLETYYKMMATVNSRPSYEQREALIQNALNAFLIEARKDPTLPVHIEGEEEYQPRSLERGYDILSQYFNRAHLDPTAGGDVFIAEKPEDVEIGFAVSIGKFVLIGKIDVVGRENFGNSPGSIGSVERQRGVIDHKSATRHFKSFSHKLVKPNDQLTTYMYGASELYGEKIRRGMLNRLYFTKKTVEFKPFITSRSDEEIEEWKRETVSKVEWIQDMWKEWQAGVAAGDKYAVAAFPKNPSRCFDYFRECSYRILCNSGCTAMREKVKAGAYRVEQWRPWQVDALFDLEGGEAKNDEQ